MCITIIELKGIEKIVHVIKKQERTLCYSCITFVAPLVNVISSSFVAFVALL